MFIYSNFFPSFRQCLLVEIGFNKVGLDYSIFEYSARVPNKVKYRYVIAYNEIICIKTYPVTTRKLHCKSNIKFEKVHD